MRPPHSSVLRQTTRAQLDYTLNRYSSDTLNRTAAAWFTVCCGAAGCANERGAAALCTLPARSHQAFVACATPELVIAEAMVCLAHPDRWAGNTPADSGPSSRAPTGSASSASLSCTMLHNTPLRRDDYFSKDECLCAARVQVGSCRVAPQTSLLSRLSATVVEPAVADYTGTLGALFGPVGIRPSGWLTTDAK